MVRFWLTDELVARFAYTETIRRPAFGDLTTAISYTEDLTKLGFGQASSGNSKLEPTTSQNYDFSLEYYFGEDLLFSVLISVVILKVLYLTQYRLSLVKLMVKQKNIF